ncbi:MAG: 6,7-dimethyl-8-ribityllumazine synthase [Opitutaceae bacterium]|jgi:6,7-dimethyl-8-ribityllumazine synthase|nr:6,7-dimethyl-8-ribityllumazine synthase [Opitutaceae bacterium]
MSLDAPKLRPLDASRLSFAVVAARFNPALVDALVDRAQATLVAAGVKPARIRIERVPGSHEVPFGIDALLRSGRFDCALALGVLIGGDTNHHEMVGNSVSFALQQISLARRAPVINGVIVANTRAQAEERTIGRINRGVEFAEAALEMAALHRRLRR